MKDGFIRVAVGTPEIHVADCEFNAQSIISLMNAAKDKKVKVLALPELCITGATAQDLFWHDALLTGAKNALKEICAASAGSDLVTVVGLPVAQRGKLYNCAAVVQGGRVIGLAPQTNVSGAKKNWFASYNEDWDVLGGALFDQTEIGAGLVFECEEPDGLRLAVVFGDDLSAADSAAARAAMAGATVIINCAADPELVGQADYRRMMVKSQSSRLTCAYLYANAGRGESTQDMVYSGHSLIAECGEILAESKPYTTGLTITEIDIQRIEADRRRANVMGDGECSVVSFSIDEEETPISRSIDPMPFVPADAAVREARCEEILNIQAQGLMQRLRHTHCKTAVIGVSGGLDSTLALLVTSRAFKLLGLPSEGIMAITMPCFGTTKRTRSNAEVLAECLGMSFREVSIAKAVTQHFEDIGQSLDDHSVTFENGQARERTQVLMDIANQCGGMVIGTGDLSELALGWATYNGDHMSMYGVNGSIPKTLVRHLVSYFAETTEDEAMAATLRDILDTPVSPELLPPDKDGKIAQVTEDLVGPYALHDFFIFYFLRYGFGPKKIFRLAKYAFDGAYSDETILKWLATFHRRFFIQQFKRSCLPDGPKVGTVGLSPRGDFHMPSDAVSALWMAEVKELTEA